MKILFRVIGKQHESYIKTGVEDFTKRIQKYCSVEWQILPPPKHSNSMLPNELKKAEEKLLLSKHLVDEYRILLDERGIQLGSVELASFLEKKSIESCKQVTFIVGGAFGVSHSVHQSVHFIWSLSNLVFPHMLVRLILAEQIYRACTINKQEKYHHL